MTSEAERALEYRRAATARVRAKEAAEKALRGDPALFRQLQQNWSPLLPWRGWDPPTGPMTGENEK